MCLLLENEPALKLVSFLETTTLIQIPMEWLWVADVTISGMLGYAGSGSGGLQ